MTTDPIPSTLDLDRIGQHVVGVPTLEAALGPNLREAQRFAGRYVQTCPIVLVWLHRWTADAQEKIEAIERQLSAVRNGVPEGAEKLTLRLVRARRSDAFGILTELYVAAWYLRSGIPPVAVLRENVGDRNAEADVVVNDVARQAFVECYETVGDPHITAWEEAWGELMETLSDLGLGFAIEVSGGAMYSEAYRLGHTVDYRRELIPALDHTEIQTIAKAVFAARSEPRPLVIASPIKRYADLHIELRDGPPVVSTSSNPSGRHFGARQLAERILEKRNRLADYGRTILVVELSRFALDVLSFHRGELQSIAEILTQSKTRWDAVLAFMRDWKSDQPHWTALLHAKTGVEPLLPKL